MKILSDYDFDLPPELIAQTPAAKRDRSRLLALRTGPDQKARCRDLNFTDLVDLIPADSVLVVNQSKVIRSRLYAKKESGGAVEVVGIEPLDPEAKTWKAMARASKALRKGARLIGPNGISIEVASDRNSDGTITVAFKSSGFDVFQEHGELPLPPYIHRAHGPTELDNERYQTVYAKDQGSVAAPTAGLHFSEDILEAMRNRGIVLAPVTLHVGLGTFAPVRCERIADHTMHAEHFLIPDETAKWVASGRPVVAVGTTSLRALEAAAIGDHRVQGGPATTSIFISPGYRFRVVDHLVTNFHLPKSTLMMLVSAFAGFEAIRAAYRHAVRERYRFFSYGDAMLLSRSPST